MIQYDQLLQLIIQLRQTILQHLNFVILQRIQTLNQTSFVMTRPVIEHHSAELINAGRIYLGADVWCHLFQLVPVRFNSISSLFWWNYDCHDATE